MLGLAALSLTGFVLDRTFGTDKATGALVWQSPNRLIAQKDQASESICPAQLGAAIEAVINRPQFRRARWGILVTQLSQNVRNRALYSHEADRYFIPASNTKLLTTAAALLALGSDYRIRTSIYDAGAGKLRLVGRGDPSFTETQLLDLAQQLKRQGIRNVKELLVEDGYFQGDVVNPTWEWEDVQADYGASVNSLILNQNAVELTLSPQQPSQPLGMRWSDAIAYRQWRIENESVTADAGTPNSVTVTAVLGQPVLRIKGQLPVDAKPETFGIAIPDPAKYFLQHFRLALALAGIKVETASVVSKVSTNSDRELAAVESPPLSALVFETNQESNNLYAEVLLRTLQVSAQTSARAYFPTFLSVLDPPKSPKEIPLLSPLKRGKPEEATPLISRGTLTEFSPHVKGGWGGSEGLKIDPSTSPNGNSADIGLKQLKATLTGLGVDPETYVLVDGSGLSRHNLVSPEAIAQTLQLMAQTPQARVYRASLPVAGISGTLKNRFRNTAAQGHLQAKTGGMTGVSALSGYLDVPGYQPLVFSIIVNQSDQSFMTLRQAIDEIVLLLTRLRSC
jgi:D-alanyl-D-alanine carboxypeptidase/D-alanyl-D-alanine-endopeptidase (penicillin-binding protein 4)